MPEVIPEDLKSTPLTSLILIKWMDTPMIGVREDGVRENSSVKKGKYVT